MARTVLPKIGSNGIENRQPKAVPPSDRRRCSGVEDMLQVSLSFQAGVAPVTQGTVATDAVTQIPSRSK
jgi:hypothetical protein